MSNPVNPVEVTEVNYKPIEARNIAFAGKYAYLADGKTGLRVLDISNPIQPIEVDGFGAGKPRYAFNVEVLDVSIHLASGEGGLSILQYNP